MNTTKTTSNVAFEGLEARQMLAASPLGIEQVAYNGGTQLVINGSTKADNIAVTPASGGFKVTNGSWSTTVTGSFNSIVVKAGRGNDKVSIDSSITTPAFLYGGRDNDTLMGGAGGDKLYGEGGTDSLAGNAGDDILVSIGDSTTDINSGGAGSDSFWADSVTSEKITDASASEIAGGNLHRVKAFNSFRTTRKGVSKVNTVSMDLSGGDLADPSLATASAKYQNFSKNPLFATTGPSADDISQGYVGDCWFLSTLSSVARTNANVIRQSVVELGDGTFAVQFANANGSKAFIRVDGDLAVSNWGGMEYAGLGQQNSTWVAIIEKAYACFRDPSANANYANLDGGWMSEAFSDLGFGSKSTWTAGSADTLLNTIAADLAAGKAVTMAIDTPAQGAPVVGSHAYDVVAVETDGNGNRTLVLRNPWGIDGAGSDGKNDGYVRLTGAQAVASFWAVISAKVN